MCNLTENVSHTHIVQLKKRANFHNYEIRDKKDFGTTRRKEEDLDDSNMTRNSIFFDCFFGSTEAVKARFKKAND